MNLAAFTAGLLETHIGKEGICMDEYEGRYTSRAKRGKHAGKRRKRKDKLDAPAGGGSVNLMFQDKVTIDLSDNAATLYYGNPSESTQDVLLQIVVQDTLIAQSGRIVPGNQVKTLELAEDAAKTLQPGGYDGKLVLSFYNPETGEKATVNTEIPVKITVEE